MTRLNDESLPTRTRKRSWPATLVCGLGIWLSATVPSMAQTTNLTYENWAEGFFTENCTLCHHSKQVGGTRFGAPRGVDFDTLEVIRENADLIRDAVLSDDPFMPPAGVLWWWDRASLREWMDAGMPGGEECLEPKEVSETEKTLYYQNASFYFTRPIDDDFNYRYMRFRRKSDKDDQVPREHRIYIRLREDGTVLMTREVWHTEDDGTRSREYSPAIPLLLSNGDPAVEDWYASVTVRERRWPRWYQGGGVEYENVTTEQWLVSHAGLERIDNGLSLPLDALKVVQTNLTTSEEISWWFAKGYGLVQRERNSPSSDWDRERVLEYNIFRGEDEPLRDPPFIQAASREWFPFVGPRHSDERTDLDYSYEFDVQGKGVFDASQEPLPTETPAPLDPDPDPTPIRPTPTFTPVGYERPESRPLPGDLSPYDPQISDLYSDQYIDSHDLLIFINHWHKRVQ